MAERRVRIGVIGVGGMGEAHCNSCSKVEEVELRAVADIDHDRAREVGEKFGVPYFDDHEQLFKEDLVDAVLIATPHYSHPPIAIDAFDAGLDVLTEKPIAVRVSVADRMIEAAEQNGRVFSVMYQMRSLPRVKKARELVAQGELGEIRRTMLVEPTFRSQAYYDSGTWRATWAGEGGGVLLNQAPHWMDVFTMLGGMPKKVLGRTRALMHDIEVEDHAEALLEYDNGVFGYYYASTCEVGTTALEIAGDKGRLVLQGDELSFYRHSVPLSEFNRTNTEMWAGPTAERVEIEVNEEDSGHHVILRNFARAVLHGEPLLAPGAEGIRSLELANAIILSSHKGEPVTIPIDRKEYHELIDFLCRGSAYKKAAKKVKRETDPNLGN